LLITESPPTTCHFPVDRKIYLPSYTPRMPLETNNLDPPESRKCLKCKNARPLTSFPWSHRKSEYTSTCIKCTDSKKDWRRKQKLAKESNKENIDPQGSPSAPFIDPTADFQDNRISVLSLEEFLTILAQQDNSVTLDANVDVKELTGGMRDRADALAGFVWESMNYRFL
jgi:hypothetical protein